MTVISPPTLAADPAIAAIQTRLYDELRTSDKVKTRADLRQMAGLQDRNAVQNILAANHGPKQLNDPRYRRTLRAISISLGHDEYWLEGGRLPTDLTVPLGVRVRNARLNKGLSISRVSVLSGVNHAMIHRLETDPTYAAIASPRTLGGVGQVLGLDMSF